MSRQLRFAGPPQALAAIRQQLEARAVYVKELRLAVALVPADAALTVLTGLDGGVKLRVARLVPVEEIFGMIEAMPMRRSERRR